MSILFEGEVLADYHQVCLVDARDERDLPMEWTEAAVKARILTADGALVFATSRNMMVPVRVTLNPIEPNIDLGFADHAVIGDLETKGEVAIAGLSDYLPSATRFAVPAGNLRVMIVSTGLGTLSADGLDGDDRYDAHIWPGTPVGVQVLRQRSMP